MTTMMTIMMMMMVKILACLFFPYRRSYTSFAILHYVARLYATPSYIQCVENPLPPCAPSLKVISGLMTPQCVRTFSLHCTPCDAAMRRLVPPLQIGLTTQAFGLTTYPLPPPATTHLVPAGRSRRSTLRQHAVLLTPFYMRSTGSTPRIVRERLQSAKR